MPIGPDPDGGAEVVTTVLTQSITLTNAQFKALPTAPITIVPAPGAGKIIRWFDASFLFNNSAGAYDPPSAPGSFIQLFYLTAVPFEASGFVDMDTAMQAPNVWTVSFPPLTAYNDGESHLMVAPTNIGTQIQNKALAIGDRYNGLDNHTGGDDANTLRVTVLYSIVDA